MNTLVNHYVLHANPNIVNHDSKIVLVLGIKSVIGEGEGPRIVDCRPETGKYEYCPHKNPSNGENHTVHIAQYQASSVNSPPAVCTVWSMLS